MLRAFIEQEQVRGAVYQLLSKCYQMPEDLSFMEQRLEQLQAMIPAIYPETDPVLKEMIDCLKKEESLDFLVQEYMTLFVGPKTLLAPPYGSLYLENKGQIMGITTMEAARYYEAAGVRKTADLHEPEDHIRIELEFIHYLIAQVITRFETGEFTDALPFAQMQRSFLDRHLGSWVRPFAQNLERKATSPFYRGLAQITEVFVRQDAMKGSYQMQSELEAMEKENLMQTSAGEGHELVDRVLAE